TIKYNATPFTGTQAIMAYADFTGNSKASVSIFILVAGENSWKDMDDTNPSNFYLDDVSGNIYDKEGWNRLTGTFTVANGEYPDLSSPRWQKLIQNGSSETSATPSGY
ncbi:MAG TPA: hypothetical protein VLV30_02105, partial [Methanomicrobiales archaeon]|nr:hypothetical protein [Methanomicrobiales archaeon]